VRKQYHFWPGTDGLDAWDVDRLIALTAGLPVEDLAVASVWELDTEYWFGADGGGWTVRTVAEHARLIAEVDPAYPIIVGPDGRVLDGMHRVARAVLEGRTHLPAVRLDPLPEPDHRGVRPEDLPYDRPGEQRPD
jgi:hypothetical protein